MPRMTKKLISHIWATTNKCYKETLAEEYPLIFKDLDLDSLDDKDMKSHLLGNGLPWKGESIDNKYWDKIIKLPTKQLELILEAHKKGKILRAQATVEAILGELLNRTAPPETKE